ncbi:acyl-CoA dehydrogenase NM domain-like protein [Rickenella mellea]|uniref:Acyl-CoA dehydrogenase NM domain-like protein n=1 Tax=Rickenella mellea TaxID=50990 RepID=A0A4Y7QIB0_9AGAM|nr:acyl-CoA dehydrogenase NM domain-like protein [Rickenella mellea]
MSHLFSASRTAHLPKTKLFQRPIRRLSLDEQCELSYQRARAIAQQYALTAHDVLTLSEKFWELHMDNVAMMDGAAITLLTIQYNLAAGTLAPFAMKRPELRPLLQRILNFDVSAQFLLTEVSHGLDAMNLETTATLLPNGEFDLNSPNEGAAKYMPPTGPYGGVPRVAIVFARLIVNNEERGLRPFVVALGDGKQMCKGVTSRLLPIRAGSKPVDHALTTFNHVRLPPSALLGKLEKPADARINFMTCIWRVTVGSLALSALAVPTVAVGTHIAARYSMRRTITGPTGQPFSIWNFRTQQLPIVRALAQVYVMKAHALEAIRMFKDTDIDVRTRMGIAASVKAAMIQHTQSSLFALSERCGAHGLFEHNQIIATQLEMRGVGIAEGDVLALSIRLATELLLGRYEMPEPRYPDCLLARHEAGLFAECRAEMSKLGSHRGEAFNRLMLPMCQPLVEAIGHRMAYEAAVDAQVPQHLLDVYENSVVKMDAAWYAEHAGVGRWAQAEMEERAATAALPYFEQDLEAVGAAPFATAPIVTKDSWDSFVRDLDCYQGDAEVELVSSPIPIQRLPEERMVHARL